MVIILLIICCATQLTNALPIDREQKKCLNYNVVTDFTVQCFGNNLGDGTVPHNDQADFCRRLKVIVDSYMRRNGPFKNINVDYQTRTLQEPTTTQAPTTTPMPTTVLTTTEKVAIPKINWPAPPIPVAHIAETEEFRLPNCEWTMNETYCAICDEGFVKQYTIFVSRTICERRCMLGFEEFRDSFDARACRPRDDTDGCMTPWCLRCRPEYWHVIIDNKHHCIRFCPPGYIANFGTRECNIVEQDST